MGHAYPQARLSRWRMTMLRAQDRLAGSAVLVAAPSQADYPSRTITMIVPFPAGGGVTTRWRASSQTSCRQRLDRPWWSTTAAASMA